MVRSYFQERIFNYYRIVNEGHVFFTGRICLVAVLVFHVREDRRIIRGLLTKAG